MNVRLRVGTCNEAVKMSVVRLNVVMLSVLAPLINVSAFTESENKPMESQNKGVATSNPLNISRIFYPQEFSCITNS
jgi:hypothetical protein